MATQTDQYAGFAYSFPIALGSVPAAEINQPFRIPVTIRNEAGRDAYLSGLSPLMHVEPGAPGTWGQPLPGRTYRAKQAITVPLYFVGFLPGGLNVELRAADWRGDDKTFSWALYGLAAGEPATYLIVPLGWTR